MTTPRMCLPHPTLFLKLDRVLLQPGSCFQSHWKDRASISLVRPARVSFNNPAKTHHCLVVLKTALERIRFLVHSHLLLPFRSICLRLVQMISLLKPKGVLMYACNRFGS